MIKVHIKSLFLCSGTLFCLYNWIIFFIPFGKKKNLVKGRYILAFLELWHTLFLLTHCVLSAKILLCCFRLPWFYIFKDVSYLHSFCSKSVKSYLIVYITCFLYFRFLTRSCFSIHQYITFFCFLCFRFFE